MQRQHQLEIDSPTLSFSSGHFTIFSAEHRENLHGHDYQLAAIISTRVGDDGLSFDYREVKKNMKALCDELNSKTILPSNNPYCRVEENSEEVKVYYADEVMTFLARDVVVLPIRNTTLEELSHWFCMTFVERHSALIQRSHIDAITMRLSTRPGQTGCSDWSLTASVS